MLAKGPSRVFISLRVQQDRDRFIQFLKRRLDELDTKFTELAASYLADHPHGLPGGDIYLRLMDKIKSVITLLTGGIPVYTLQDTLLWLVVEEEFQLFADDKDDSIFFRAVDGMNGWLMGFGKENDPVMERFNVVEQSTKLIHEWTCPDMKSDSSRFGSRLIRWNQFVPVVEVMNKRFCRKFDSAHFYLCHSGLRQGHNVPEITHELKNRFLQQFLDLCNRYGIHRYGENVNMTQNPFDETEFLYVKKGFNKFYSSDFEYTEQSLAEVIPDVPLNRTILNRGRETDVNTCWFNSSLHILSTLKEIVFKFSNQIQWKKDVLSTISFDDIRGGRNDGALELLGSIFSVHGDEASIVAYQLFFQVLMSSLFKAQLIPRNSNKVVYTSGLLSVFRKIVELKQRYCKTELWGSTATSEQRPGQFASFTDNVQNMISFLGHDLTSLFTIKTRPATLCTVCNLVAFRPSSNPNFLVYEVACPNSFKSLSELVVKEGCKFTSQISPDVCGFCGAELNTTCDILVSTSQYLMVHPSKNNPRATTQPTVMLDSRLDLPLYQNNCPFYYPKMVQYRLKAFVHLDKNHFTTYTAIEDNEDFWIYRDDNELPSLKERKENAVYPVEMAIYERVSDSMCSALPIASSDSMSSSLPITSLHDKMYTETVDLLITRRFQGTTKSKKELEKFDKYDKLVRAHPRLAPLVMQILDKDRLTALDVEINTITIEDNESPMKDAVDVDLTNSSCASPEAPAPCAQLEFLSTKMEECGTCGNVKSGKMVKILSCGHSDFCWDCIQAWMIGTTIIQSNGRVEYQENHSRCPICKIHIDGVQHLTYDEQLQVSRGINDFKATKVVDDEILRRIASSEPHMIDCEDAVLVPRDSEDPESLFSDTNRVLVDAESLFSDSHYLCSLPSFIWRALNSVSFLVSSVTKNWITGTSPRNQCKIRGCKIKVNLITNSNWTRWGREVDLNRVAFAFTLTFDNASLTLAVWEKSNEADEWEVGPPGDYNTFFSEYDEVTRKYGKIFPLNYLLSRMVQVMTGS